MRYKQIIFFILLGLTVSCDRVMGPVGKTVTFQEEFVFQDSSGSVLFDMFASKLFRVRYIVTYKAVVEKDLGESVKVVIKSANVEPVRVGGNVSMKQLEYKGQAEVKVSENIGETRVLNKRDVPELSVKGG